MQDNYQKIYTKTLFFLSFFLFMMCVSFPAYSQYTIIWPDKHNVTTARFFNPDKKNGFVVSASLVALFTSGTRQRDGFRIGCGLNLAYRAGHWTMYSGIDAYKAREKKFGIGTSYLGSSFFNGKMGGTYLVNRYFQAGKQISSIIGIRITDFEFKFENDFLAYPFTGFKRYDRFRTAAVELRYKRILLGMNVYTTDCDGVTDFSFGNKKGVYRNGKQISTPIYVGYTDKGILIRGGINSRFGGFFGQNNMHRQFFNTADFKEVNFKMPFFQIGTNQFYTLY